jgi:hypothetical protein
LASHRIIARGLTIALIGSTLLVTAACSRPTPVGSGGDTTPEAGEPGGEATQSSPYDVTSAPPPANSDVYPPPASATPPTPAAYLAPGEGGAEATETPAAEPTQTP